MVGKRGIMAHKLVALFVRHGETDANKKRLFRGPKDYELDDAGKAEAENIGKMLKGYSFNGTFSSSRKRSKQTAAIARPNDKVRSLKALDPLNVGDYAGQPKNEENLKKILYFQDHPDEKIPGGDSINEFRKRVNPKIMMLVRRGESSTKPSLGFVHSSTIHQIGHLFHGDHNHVKVKPGGTVGVFSGPDGYYAKALTKKSDDPKDKHMVS